MEEKESQAQREKVIQSITVLMRTNPFSFEFKVKKNPKGIKVIYEVSQEELEELLNSLYEIPK